MNRERAKELLPIIQAFAEGKDVQVKEKGGRYDGCFITQSDIDFYGEYEYRIKPEPEVIFVNKHNDLTHYSYKREGDAVTNTHGAEKYYEYIAKRFIEVTE